MFKKSLVAVATIAVLATSALPVFAAESVFNNGSPSRAGVVQELNQKGIKATSVEQWGNYIRAYVTQPDGSQTQEFFTPGSLQQVNL
ncbi:MAG TPA: hypothetical protein VGO70_03910 [Arsenicitalea sp.]|jgi:hypothetical protein|nr:hypothetical protein [Arsenicitalea sp.]